jgi:MFS family permease
MDSRVEEQTELSPLPKSSNDGQRAQREREIPEEAEFKASWSLWCILVALSLFSFLSALDGTIITTSLPTIAREIGANGQQLYLWTAQCFFFASTVPQPLLGQVANIFGRRNPLFAAIALFTLGSGLSGGARSPAMLIAGRTVQGLGASGLYVFGDIIICDLVPPLYRGSYLSIFFTAAGIGSTVGPVIGGALAEAGWRWIFYLNIPIAAVGFFCLVLLLKVNYTRNATWLSALRRLDLLGALLFIPSIFAILYALITGGIQYPWSSWHIILPLVLGIFGSALFFIYQATTSLCSVPSVPIRLFANRTSATGFLLVFFSSIILQAISYFLPVYFQAVKFKSPLLSGVYYLPFSLAILPFAGGGGWLLSKYGRYIPIHYAGFALLIIGSGLFSILDAESSSGQWVGFQIISSAGMALIFTTTLPSTLAPLPESDVAVATAIFSFTRSFGFVWGITIAGIVFNGQIDAHLSLVQDSEVRGHLSNGAAYAFVSTGQIRQLTDATTRSEVIEVYVKALRVVWLVTVAVGLLGLFCIPMERHVKLKASHATEYGMKEKPGTRSV